MVGCVIYDIAHEISLLDDVVPIGRPIANTRIYILDGSGAPVPLGAVGELYIGGAGVARGYLNRPDLTAERFLKDPFSPAPGARMYRTGDLARYLPDGNIEFLGRNDDQVKIRGFRIEPGRDRGAPGRTRRRARGRRRRRGEGSAQRLVAYVVAAPEEDLAGSLRAHLSARLPDYMVPAAFVRLDALPLTPNGKLDRAARCRIRTSTPTPARPTSRRGRGSRPSWPASGRNCSGSSGSAATTASSNSRPLPPGRSPAQPPAAGPGRAAASGALFGSPDLAGLAATIDGALVRSGPRRCRRSSRSPVTRLWRRPSPSSACGSWRSSMA